jgi:hypothetical protein
MWKQTDRDLFGGVLKEKCFEMGSFPKTERALKF